jgi:phosphoribosylaminoimidazole-succinocarboxamide synthase
MMTTGLVSATVWASCSGKVEEKKQQPQAVLKTDLKGLKKIYSGKVRDIYAVDEDTVLQVATDRLSSFDVVMLNGIPNKGKILTQLAVWWFEYLEKELGMPHHLVTADVDKMPAEVRAHADAIRGRCMLVKKLDMLPVESIVRGYITGSGLQDYNKTGKVCGVTLPLGLRDCDKLPNPIFTPSTKAELGTHDENITMEQCEKIIGHEKSSQLASKSLKIYDRARRHAESKGIILADTKFEFGLDPKTGAIVLADEIITPDCSRFWEASKYQPGRQQDSLDKQIVRNYLLSINYDKATPVNIPDDVVKATMNKYIDAFVTLTGKQPIL